MLEKALDVNLKAHPTGAPLVDQKPGRQGAGNLVGPGPRIAYPGLAHYAASKSGFNGFVRAAALELAKYGITVNGVEPGMIATAAAGNLGGDGHQAEIARGGLCIRTLLPRA